MEVTAQERQRMNEIYFALSTKQAQLFHGLYHRIFQLSSGFSTAMSTKSRTEIGRWTTTPSP